MDASVEVEEQMEIEEKVDTKETPKLSWAEKEKLRQERNSRPINIVRRFGVVNVSPIYLFTYFITCFMCLFRIRKAPN